MSMIDWAEREVEIACKWENPDRKEGEWDYGCACYESALKAFKSLMEDGHSGFSISMTKHILNRLIDGKPLTLIEDTEDIWNECGFTRSDGTAVYQNKRMSALFKNIHSDGSKDFDDVDQFVCCNVNNPNLTYHSGLIDKVMKDKYPITMPYMPPSKPFFVYTEDFLTDKKNGDYDTVGILYCMTPEGDKVEINRYFKECGDGFEEIDFAEYEEKKAIKINR